MYGILIYGFPLLLIVFEWGLRNVMQIDSSGFIGPTLAAAALSFLVPLAKPKQIDLTQRGRKHVLVNARDQQLIPLVWLVILAGLFAWSASCYFSVKGEVLSIHSVPIHIAIGLGVYFTSLILVAVKEAI